MNYDFDVAIVGGGPSGSTAATLLKKYDPTLSVLIVEREIFPRDHVGESQLPACSYILAEMGAWDKVEAAGFPIKIGSTNRWGKNPELWDFEFFPSEYFQDEPRPAKFEGQRLRTAFQVDRAIYDEILLDHAEEMGAVVREGTKVASVIRDGDRIDGLVLESGEVVRANHYIDASGHVGVLRRAMEVECKSPTSLQNIALWDYWQNADWAEKIGVGGTKVQVMSLGYGWIWFIPLGPTRTSIGLIVPADYYKQCSKRPEELYRDALAEEERISKLIANAASEKKFQTTKDWSFVSSRQCGDNWFLSGESAGFADPILAAGMTMAHAAGREVAFTILELNRGKADAAWLKEQFELRQSQRIVNHIRFADFWYTANAQFADIKDFTQQIAKDVGLEMSPDKAWQWLAQGGFIDEDLTAGTGGFSLNAIKKLGNVLSDLDGKSPFAEFNVFKLNLRGASWKDRADYRDGRVIPSQCYIRDGKVLPIDGAYQAIVDVLQQVSSMDAILDLLKRGVEKNSPVGVDKEAILAQGLEALEALIADEWVTCSYDSSKPRLKVEYLGQEIRLNKESISARN